MDRRRLDIGQCRFALRINSQPAGATSDVAQDIAGNGSSTARALRMTYRKRRDDGARPCGITGIPISSAVTAGSVKWKVVGPSERE